MCNNYPIYVLCTNRFKNFYTFTFIGLTLYSSVMRKQLLSQSLRVRINYSNVYHEKLLDMDLTCFSVTWRATIFVTETAILFWNFPHHRLLKMTFTLWIDPLVPNISFFSTFFTYFIPSNVYTSHPYFFWRS